MENRRVVWVVSNASNRAVVFDSATGDWCIALTEPFLAMTVEQRLAVEKLVLEVARGGTCV